MLNDDSRTEEEGAAELRARVQRLEEALGFAERTVEQLSEEVRGLGARVREMHKRLEQMERRVGSVDERVERIAGGKAGEDQAKSE